MAKAAVTRSIRDDHQKNFLKIFNGLTGKHSRWEIWEDFVTLTAIEISNSTDKVNATERTKMYQTIISKYSAKERDGMAEMLAEVVMGMEQNPDQDFLGSLYMMCELGNDHAGQFFTPYDVCRCMAEITFDPKLHPDMEGFISVSDPACGAGATLLAFLNVCKRRNICYHNKVLVIAQDIDFIVGLCMANLVYEMILSGELDPKQLTVTFIDEEGLYPSMVDAAYRWRRNFLSVGAKFLWFCLPFKQVSVIDHLSSSESWITWEPGKEDVWMRKPPDFAIMYSPYLHYAGEMNYQTFCSKAFSDGIQLVGLRTAESLTRFKCIANTKMERITRGGKFYPIYDWKDSDVWLYIKERNLEFPEIYMRLYEAGVRKNALRLCAFFGDCGTQGLRWIAETDNDLWERIQRREPNAYLVLLYWDSEMFRRTTRKRGELEEESEKKDYKALCKDLLFLHPERYTIAKDTLSHIEHWRGLFIKTYGIAEQKHYKTMYEGLLYGDPKMRILRILWTTIYNDHNARIKEEQNHGKH